MIRALTAVLVAAVSALSCQGQVGSVADADAAATADPDAAVPPPDYEYYVRVDAAALPRTNSSHILGVNLDPRQMPGYLDDSPGGFLEQVRLAGVRMVNFPMGCTADGYNWQNPDWHGDPNQPHMSIDEMLVLADQIGADVYYNVNMAGGINGSPHGQDNCLSDRNGHHRGTLAELELLVQTYGDRIKHYKLSNEPWVNLLFCTAGDDCWTAEEYRSVALSYATAIREHVPDAQIYLPAMSLTLTTIEDQAVWTAMLRGLFADHPGLFAGVTEQSWTYESLEQLPFWPRLSGAAIHAARRGDDSAGYDIPGASLAFDEWNLGAWRWEPDDPDNPGGTLSQALYTAEMLRLAMAEGAPFSFYYSLYETASVNAPNAPTWSIVKHGPGGQYSDTEMYPSYYAYRLLAQMQRDVLPHQQRVPTLDIAGREDASSPYNAFLSPASGVSSISSLVTISEQSSRMAIYLANLSPDQATAIGVIIDGFRSEGELQWFSLSGESLASRTVGQDIVYQTTNQDVGRYFDVVLPPHSAHVLILDGALAAE